MKITLAELRNVIKSVLSEARGKGDPADYMGAWVVTARGEDGKTLYKTGDTDTGKSVKMPGGGSIEQPPEGPGYWHPNQKKAKIYTTEKGAQSGMMAEKMAGVKTAAIKRIF